MSPIQQQMLEALKRLSGGATVPASQPAPPVPGILSAAAHQS
jgi:hypothetical protein